MLVKEFLAEKSAKYPRVLEYLSILYLERMISYLETNNDEFWQNYEHTLEDITVVSKLSIREIYVDLNKLQKIKDKMANGKDDTLDFDDVHGGLYEQEAYPISEHIYYTSAPHVIKRKTFVEQAAETMVSVSKCIDLGVGPGVLLASLLSENRKWFGCGIDISARCVLYARRMMKLHGLTERAHIQRADIRTIPYQDGSFDLVVATEVLEHLPDPHKGLIEAVRILRHGGAIIVALPVQLRLPEHLHLFSDVEEVKQAYSDVGLAIEQFDSWQSEGGFIDTFAVCRKP